MSKEIIKKWEKDCGVLVGKTVKSVRYLTDSEMEDFMWSCRPLAIFFTDGTYLIPSKDDEGNDGGALFTNIKNLPTIPVIWE
jgi:hypothetical protein